MDTPSLRNVRVLRRRKSSARLEGSLRSIDSPHVVRGAGYASLDAHEFSPLVGRSVGVSWDAFVVRSSGVTISDWAKYVFAEPIATLQSKTSGPTPYRELVPYPPNVSRGRLRETGLTTNVTPGENLLRLSSGRIALPIFRVHPQFVHDLRPSSDPYAGSVEGTCSPSIPAFASIDRRLAGESPHAKDSSGLAIATGVHLYSYNRGLVSVLSPSHSTVYVLNITSQRLA
ncbi:uncharacterized protein B0H18DRAFT_1122223 [Fomitopsis serialis]|uniref:uncharacterized protein n=1 Tax=Fomitopsis serialis TaxID=139415 RepID=UPI0020080666|nr:uncharacterized protein B0H18DRAFT_1122223 [Neoantrodia serialis]KAH9919916.1 hypothetical protein B0H18DRAFT_1122223 [Neoantrodia serialis]